MGGMGCVLDRELEGRRGVWRSPFARGDGMGPPVLDIDPRAGDPPPTAIVAAFDRPAEPRGLPPLPPPPPPPATPTVGVFLNRTLNVCSRLTTSSVSRWFSASVCLGQEGRSKGQRARNGCALGAAEQQQEQGPWLAVKTGQGQTPT